MNHNQRELIVQGTAVAVLGLFTYLYFVADRPVFDTNKHNQAVHSTIHNGQA